LAICKDSSVAGTCGEITCSGDAIQCATLRAAAALECRDKSDRDDLGKSPLVGSGDAILQGNDPMKGQIDAALKGDTVDMGGSSLDRNGFLG
nr:hypothetical protein [Tanacetum cinerariifolium]